VRLHDPYWLYQEILRLRDLLRLVAGELERLAAAETPTRSDGSCC
jgi:hypothetical protein